MPAFNVFVAVISAVFAALAAWFIVQFLMWLLPIIAAALLAICAGVAVYREVREHGFARITQTARDLVTHRFIKTTVEV